MSAMPTPLSAGDGSLAGLSGARPGGASAVVGADLSDQAHPHRGADLAPAASPTCSARALGATADRSLRPAGGRSRTSRRGAGHIGTDFVAKAAPDGYTLLVTADADLRRSIRISTASCPTTRSTISCRSAGSASARRRWCVHPVGAGQHVRRADRLRQDQAGRAQLRNLRHRHQRPSQHHSPGKRDRHEVHARPLSRRGARRSPICSAATSR